jgi:hypothetical protein
MKNFMYQLAKDAILATFVVPLAIVSHELGHFLSYLWYEAQDVRLLAFSVSAETQELSSTQLAVANMIGPVISYVTVIIAALCSSKKYSSFWIMLGLTAPIGRIVNAVYIYYRILGYHPNPNFDEYNFSRNLKIEPLLVSVPTMMIVVGCFYFFGRSAWKHGGLGELVRIVACILIGLAVWTQVGPNLLS